MFSFFRKRMYKNSDLVNYETKRENTSATSERTPKYNT